MKTVIALIVLFIGTRELTSPQICLRARNYVQPELAVGQIGGSIPRVKAELVGFTTRITPQDACADAIDKCKQPVKYLGSNDDCSCFACEYGKPTQQNICTKNESDKKHLLKMAEPE